MTKRVFCAGFVWRVIEQKWPASRRPSLHFSRSACCSSPTNIGRLARDTRIVRNPQKIRSVRENAAFVSDAGKKTKVLTENCWRNWPEDDQVGAPLNSWPKGGSRLGGMTGQYFLRFVGFDSFILSRDDVVACLREAGVELSEKASSKKDMRAAQAAFTTWRKESGLSYVQLSRICAMSTGENMDPATLAARGAGED